MYTVRQYSIWNRIPGTTADIPHRVVFGLQNSSLIVKSFSLLMFQFLTTFVGMTLE
jgi:hypothetical protein